MHLLQLLCCVTKLTSCMLFEAFGIMCSSQRHLCDRHLKQYLIDIPVDNRSTLYRYLTNSQLIVSRVLTDLNELALDQLLTDMSVECQ